MNLPLRIEIDPVDTKQIEIIKKYKWHISLTEKFIEYMVEIDCNERENENDDWDLNVRRTMLKLIPKNQISSIELVDFHGINNINLYNLNIEAINDCIAMNFTSLTEAREKYVLIKNWLFK